MSEPLPDLTGCESTRDTLHRYSKVLGAVRRTLAEPDPRWWHISLRVDPRGLSTGEMPAPGGGACSLCLDLKGHRLEIAGPGGERSLPLDAGLTATELGRRTLGLLAELGIAAEVDETRFADDRPAVYDRAGTARLHHAYTRVAERFASVAGTLAGEVGPVQLWPHHFDVSFEWFGRALSEEERDGSEADRAQIGFGFSPGDEGLPEPYLYANPWPFDPALTAAPLPSGAVWNDAGWQGGLLPWAAVCRGGEGWIDDFVRAVYDAAAPRLAG